MSLDISIQPDYRDYDDGKLRLSYTEFEKLNVPDVHDFAYRGSERRFDRDWRLYNRLDDYFTEQSEAVPSIRIGYHAFELIRQTIVNNLPPMRLLTPTKSKKLTSLKSTVAFLTNYDADGIYPAVEVQNLAVLLDLYPLTKLNRQELRQRGFYSEYQAFVDLVQQAAAQGKALEFD